MGHFCLLLFAHQVKSYLMTGLAILAGDPFGLEAVLTLQDMCRLLHVKVIAGFQVRAAEEPGA
jgi:hypothetical protein